MRLKTTIALGIGALALCAFPALGAANHGESNGTGLGRESLVATYHPTYTPSPPSSGPPPHAKAYGFHCKGQSKKHVKGEKGTPFSRCVKAMARADKNENLAPGQACKGMSKKHVKGQKGTPFSRCVKGVVQMRREERELEQV